MLGSIWQWIGIGAGYALAVALVVVGGYLAIYLGANPLNPFSKLFRYVGFLLIAAGIVTASYNYGKSVGAADCEAAWKAKDYDAAIARLKQEADAKALAAETAAKQAQDLAAQNDDQQKQIAQYQMAVSAAAVGCRISTSDDDRRMCELTGDAAPGCQPAK